MSDPKIELENKLLADLEAAVKTEPVFAAMFELRDLLSHADHADLRLEQLRKSLDAEGGTKFQIDEAFFAHGSVKELHTFFRTKFDQIMILVAHRKDEVIAESRKKHQAIRDNHRNAQASEN